MGQQISRSNSPGADRMGETQSLLPVDPEQVNNDGCFPPHSMNDVCPANPHAELPIYTTIHRIRRDVIAAIDDPYSLDQLRDPRMNLSVVRPLVDRFYALKDVSIIYCLLANRVQFQRELLTRPHQQSVCTTRALLCELIANRILRRYHEDNSGIQGLLLLSQILVGSFDPFQGAPDDIAHDSSSFISITPRTVHNKRLPALELAIISEAKSFLSSSACQRVVNAIYEGRVVYTPTSFIDILPDRYKHKPISLYNPRKAPLLNQYRLVVPRTRNFLEICHFIILLALFLFIMAERDPSSFSARETVFMIYTLGWVLDQIGSILEHGWHVYTENLWSFLDVTFSVVFSIYLCLRIHGWRTGSLEFGQQALDVLAMGGPVLVPRLAFNLMSENMLFISLREMMRNFTILTILAVWCFAGFLLSMMWLSNGVLHPVTICKWMLWVWFGLDGTGIQRSVDFHWLLGPILMVTFAFLGNTLFLTILVSMLSTTFSTIVSNATAEIQFRRAVLTFEGVKADAIFAYQPPLNILALLILLPLKMLISPRWFHKINVAAIRTLNAPLLLIISLLERRTLWAASIRRQRFAEHLPKLSRRKAIWDFSRGFSAHADIQAVFDAEPPQEIQDEIENDDDLGQHHLQRTVTIEASPGVPNQNKDNGDANKSKASGKRRRDSIYPFEHHSTDNAIMDDGEDTGDVKERLQALEESTRRIEEMLARLCNDISSPPKSESASVSAGWSGTLQDLDKSATTDIET